MQLVVSARRFLTWDGFGKPNEQGERVRRRREYERRNMNHICVSALCSHRRPLFTQVCGCPLFTHVCGASLDSHLYALDARELHHRLHRLVEVLFVATGNSERV